MLDHQKDTGHALDFPGDEENSLQVPFLRKALNGDDDEDERTDSALSCASLGRVLFVVFFLGIIIFFAVDSLTTQYTLTLAEDICDELSRTDIWVIIGSLFIFGFLSPLVGIPYTIYPCASGYLIHEKLGNFWQAFWMTLVLASTAPLLGGLLAFFMGRGILNKWAKRMKEKFRIFMAIEAVLGDKKESIQIQCLLRLSPLVPTAFINMALGCTSNCKTSHFTIAFLFGGTFYAVPLSYVGCLFNAATDLETNDDLSLNSPLGLAIAILGVIGSVLATVAITCYTKKRLRALSTAFEASFVFENEDDEDEEEREEGGGR
ncbi:hypothetical protein TrVE_jg3857 [Triparma verrucosa]|uniref:VTT domain-containing protein n=1 Tax=Triparma verrucosa TaxID=1606542 RepID=A0A9W7BZZ9_9STRA|nr:hypothetical protein TrVE_jg3857 [Triparma verrucosa]